MHRTTSKTELGGLDSPSGSYVLSGYSVRLEFLKDVPQDWTLSCRLPLGPQNEASEELHKTDSRFWRAACIEQRHQTAVLFDDQNVRLYAEACMASSGSRKPGSSWSPQYKLSGVVDESRSGNLHWI